jgi:hypothetical protein
MKPTSELTGAALDWAVAKCERLSVRWDTDEDAFIYFDREEGANREWSPSTNWAQGGPIIERERIPIGPQFKQWWAGRCDVMDDDNNGRTGATPLIAAMRCYVASKLGDTVDIPEELT